MTREKLEKVERKEETGNSSRGKRENQRMQDM